MQPQPHLDKMSGGGGGGGGGGVWPGERGCEAGAREIAPRTAATRSQGRRRGRQGRGGMDHRRSLK